MTAFTAGELAGALGGRVEGDPDVVLTGVADLREASTSQLSFVSNTRYLKYLPASSAGAVLIGPKVRELDRTVIRVPDAYVAFAHALALFHPPSWPAGGVDERASVSPQATLGEGVTVEPFAVVRADAVVGAGSWIQSGAYVGAGATLGASCRLMPNSCVMEDCVLGDRVWLNPGAVVGGEGFGFAPGPDGLVKIPQPGRAVVEDDVEIGANSTVDRAALGETRVLRGAKLDNHVQVGHAATVGAHNVLVAYSGVAGSSTLGTGVTLAARTSVLGHLEIGDGVTVGAHSMVSRSTPAGTRLSGVPAIDHRTWLRAATALAEVPELLRQVRRLEAEVARLSARQEET
ncbi:MAG: UDP-3-O-(3-hydroxymyristoyl)glucosamine N-acyltransferase [Proteobacteria bacterium]|nr:UDP-3-O-(3-hydroxymyristoyl)glucosamine N-acyltransferase [Pseudomonadota bacterium]MCP4920276.1 UDP-3-O-(3-hydroxymyristoyl)glucosamine N-acyltransferase [Pseudomonadota bacterium]